MRELIELSKSAAATWHEEELWQDRLPTIMTHDSKLPGVQPSTLSHCPLHFIDLIFLLVSVSTRACHVYSETRPRESWVRLPDRELS